MASRKKQRQHERDRARGSVFYVTDDVLIMAKAAEHMVKEVKGGGWMLAAPGGTTVCAVLEEEETFCTLRCKDGKVEIDSCPVQNRQKAEQLLASFEQSKKKA